VTFVSVPIVGATRSHHLQEAVDALGLRLTDEDVLELERPSQQFGPSWF
jgi:aryl-alcohol dehydrogenase-like predicted oxidoreductase